MVPVLWRLHVRSLVEQQPASAARLRVQSFGLGF